VAVLVVQQKVHRNVPVPMVALAVVALVQMADKVTQAQTQAARDRKEVMAVLVKA
jgi:signal transduction protein with GAF and PtsI domain